MYNIRIIGTQTVTGFDSEMEFQSPDDISEATVIFLFDTDVYEVVAYEVEEVSDVQ